MNGAINHTAKTDLLMLSKIFLFFAFILLMFNGRGVTNSAFVFNISPSISYTLAFIFECLALIFALYTYKIKLDKVIFFLYIQIIVYTFSLLVSQDALAGMKYYLAALEALVIYTFCMVVPTEKLNKSILYLAEVSIVIIVFYTVSVALTVLSMGMADYLVKGNIIIPIGESNYIASFLNMFLVIVLGLEYVKARKIIFVLLIAIGITFTRSDVGILLFGSILIFEYGIKLLRNKSIKEIAKSIVVIVAIVLVIIKAFDIFSNYFWRYIAVLNALFRGGAAGIEEASNGRIAIYKESFRMFTESPILGYGLNYSENLEALSHNLIFDILLKGGLINFLIFICYMSIILTRLYKYRNQSIEVKTIWKMLIVVLLNAMVEPTLGSFNFNFFFWIFCGVGMANSRRLIKDYGKINSPNV